MFGYRNRTENGTEKLVGARAAAEKKVAELKVRYPHVTWELLEIEIKTSRVPVYLPGKGRAGNSYRSTRLSNSVGRVTVLGVI